jgi:RNA polymerase sigma factor (sigma-70 family)
MSDKELVSLVKSFLAKPSGATAEECHAWEEFFVTYDLVIRVNIRKLHKGIDVIDDLTQEVWTKLIRKFPRWAFDPAKGSIAAWVTKIAQRLAMRRARRGSKRNGESLSETSAATLVDPEPGPDIEVEQMQEHEFFAALVSEFAQGLSARDGQIVERRFLNSWGLLEIARELEASVICIRSVIHRVKPKLLDFLRRRGLGPV